MTNVVFGRLCFTSFGFGEEFGAAKDNEADTMALYKGQLRALIALVDTEHPESTSASSSRRTQGNSRRSGPAVRKRLRFPNIPVLPSGPRRLCCQAGHGQPSPRDLALSSTAPRRRSRGWPTATVANIPHR